jgi:RNA polymerase sigma factor (sigma-70 family)
MNDQELLREYAQNGSEDAFAALVRKHIDLVHTAAKRMVVDPHLAQDVTQSVFLALAKSAPKLHGCAVLSGWLHRTTRNLAAMTVRGDVRRRVRENEVAFMNQDLETKAEWEDIAPQLDEALEQLSSIDRDALLLRYFQRQTAREIGQLLGISEEAAQKRLVRSLDQLDGLCLSAE